MTAHATPTCNGTHDAPPCGDPDCWAREDPPGLTDAIDIAGVVDPWPLAGIPAAPPAPVADDVRAALAMMLAAYDRDRYRSWEKGVPEWHKAVEAAHRALEGKQS